VAGAGSLASTLGRNEVRIYDAGYRPPLGATVEEAQLPQRLGRLGYERVHRRPDRPGEYFWGRELFWVYQHELSTRPARLVGWRLNSGRVSSWIDGGSGEPRERKAPIDLEAELLGTTFRERRAQTRWIAFDSLPEHVWRPLLAIEDNRFLEHMGVDGRAVARALLANVKKGGVAQGGSTITQQLIKMRDLTPKRSLGRKASEALRALALEAEFSKEEILEGYLNLVYYGHYDGAHVYGIDAAARTFYSLSVADLDLSRAAALAALVQAPNRLSPIRNPEALAGRYSRVLDRLEELEWADTAEVDRARRQGLPQARPSTPVLEPAPHFRAWVGERIGISADERPGGIVIETTLDAHLQSLAEAAVESGLQRLRRSHPGLRNRPLSAGLIALDATNGRVLAHVGGDPRRPDEFDRVRSSRRQPGSTVKPLVALEALGPCGAQPRLFSSRRVLDKPLTLPLPDGDAWAPQNADRLFRGAVTVRRTLVESLNVPTVRLARHCGFEATAKRLRRAGLDLPEAVQPAFVLGAIETSALKLATAYSLFPNRGRVTRPRPVARVRGNRRVAGGEGSRRAASAGAAWLVRDLLARPDGKTWGKTGTSSGRRDAWYAGGSGRLVAVVWVGLDDDRSLGAGGATAAEPIWREFVVTAAPTLPAWDPPQPRSIVEHWVDTESGLRLKRERSGSESFHFDRSARPPIRRLWRRRSPLAPID